MILNYIYLERGKKDLFNRKKNKNIYIDWKMQLHDRKDVINKYLFCFESKIRFNAKISTRSGFSQYTTYL